MQIASTGHSTSCSDLLTDSALLFTASLDAPSSNTERTAAPSKQTARSILHRYARRFLRSQLIASRRVQRATEYIHFKAIRQMGDISPETVKKYFSSMEDPVQALEAASQGARAYLSRRSTHATHMAFSGFLDILDSKLGKALGVDEPTGPTSSDDLTSGMEERTGDDAVNLDKEMHAKLMADAKHDLDSAPPCSDTQAKLVCQMFKDAQASARHAVRLEREYIDSVYRTRLRTMMGTAQTLSASGLNTARVYHTRTVPRCSEPDAVVSSFPPAHRFVVSSRPGIQSPVHLNNVRACSASGAQSVAISCALLGDTGSGTCLIGEADFKRLQALGVAIRVSKLNTSVEQIAGIGAVNLVLYHASFHLDFGGEVVRFEDVPVLSGHDGILLGNDFHRATRTVYDFDECYDADGVAHDGFIVLRDSERRPVSTPIFFSHAPAVRHPRTASTSLAESAVPIAFNPEALNVPKWSETLLRVRVPAAALGDHPILVLPLDDDRVKALPVLVSAGIYKPDTEGFVHLRVINPTQQRVRIAQLSALARFIIDPSFKDADLEFTSEQIIENITLSPGCTHLMREDILAMLQTRRRLFASKLGWAHGYQHSVDIPPDAIPPNIPPRRLAPQEYAALKEAVDKQMKAGLLEYCSSPFNARPMMVPKFGGGYRCVLDYRRLNELVLKAGSGCSYPLPSVESNLNSLAKAKWYTAVDLLMGFHQLEMVDGLRGKLATAFSTPWGQMCYTRMPMGLTSSPGAFMSVVDAALRGLPPGIAVAYVDDILIPTDGDWNDHLRDVGLVFDRLLAAGFTVNPKKVFMGMREVPYLGYLVGSAGTRPNPERTKAIFDMAFEQIRTDAAAAARFSGMISFYSKFLKNLHITLAPFHALKAKHADVPSILNSLKLQAAFEVLRHQLATVTSLTRPDYSKDFHLAVDTASSVGVGAALMQLDDDSDPTSLRPVAFWSHRLTENERGWHVRDQECYGMVCALREWRPYILGTHTNVLSDHKSLKWLMSTNHANGSRVQHWVADIQQYDLEINYLPGHDNVVADCFSRAVTLCLRVLFVGATDATSFSSVGGVGMITSNVAHTYALFNGPAGPPAGRSVPDRVCLLVLSESLDKILVVSSPVSSGFALPSCRYPRDTTMSYRDAVARIVNETFTPTSAALLVRVACTSLQFRSRITEDGIKRAYFYACSLAVQHVLECSSAQHRAAWADISNNAQLRELNLSPEDFAFCSNIVAHRDGYKRPYSYWRAHNYGKLLGSRLATVLTATSAASAAPAADLLPRFSTGQTVEKDGAIFCDTVADATHAMDYIQHCLVDESVVAIDLEGTLAGARPHVALLQAGTSRSSFVFDTHVAPTILDSQGCGLRELLTDARITKVLHACHGDAYALRVEHRIFMAQVFDTAIADAILLYRHPGCSRGLGAVLTEWLGDAVVHLTHKGKLVHVPFMFNVRPLTLEHFVYSAEDVEYCVLLYNTLVAILRQRGFLELALTLSMDRCQPHDIVPLHSPHITFAIVDADWVICLRSRSSGLLEFPTCSSVFDVSWLHAPIQKLKEHMSAEWASLMGPAPSAGRFTTYVSSHVRKPRRLGNFFVAFCVYPSLLSIHLALCNAFKHSPLNGSHRLVLRPRRHHHTGFISTHVALMQGLHLWTTLGIATPSRSLALPRRKSRPTLTRQTAARTVQRCFRAHHAASAHLNRAHVNVVLGRQLTSSFAALIVHDDTHAFVLSGATPSMPWCFPSAPVAVGASLSDTAVQGFDKYAGPAARKGSSQASPASEASSEPSWQLLPRLSSLIQKGIESSVALGDFGPLTTFFSCYAPGIANHASSFYASRNDFNGFRLTATEVRKHPHAGVVTIAQALHRLSTGEASALKASLARHCSQNVAVSTCARVYMQLGLSSTPHSPLQCPGCLQATRVNMGGGDLASQGLAVTSAHCHQCGYIGEPQRDGTCSSCFASSGLPPLGTEQVGNAFLGAVSCAFESHVSDFNDVQRMAVCLFSRPLNVSDLLGYTDGGLDDLARDVQKDLDEAYGDPCHSGQSPDFAAPNETQGPQDVDSSCHSGQPTVSEPRYMASASPLEIDDLPLPRVPQPEPDSSSSTGSPDSFRMPKLADVIDAQRSHPAIAPYFAFHISGTSPADLSARELCDFEAEAALVYIDLDDGALRRVVRAVGTKGPLVLPPQFRTHALRECHDRQCHCGISKCWPLLRRLYWWPHARRDLRMYIRLCQVCRRIKIPRHKAGQGQVVNNGFSPWSFVTCDVYDVGWESGGFTKVLAFVDQFSRGVLTVPLATNHTSEDIAHAIVYVLQRFHGRPLAVRSDRGSVLISEVIAQLYEQHNIVMEDGTAYHHATAGVCERFFSVLRHMLLTHRLASKDEQWHMYIPLLEMAYNNTVNKTTGFSPFFINHLRHADLSLDVLTGRPHRGEDPLKSWVATHLERMVLVWAVCTRQLGLQALDNKATQDMRRETRITYSPGQSVILVKGRVVDGNLPKVEDPTDGPYTVLKALPRGNYVLANLRSLRMHEVINEERLMPWPTRRLETEEALGQRYTVQRIVDRKECTDKAGNKFYKYKVRWAGWHSKADSWRTMDGLQEVAPLVAAFNRVKPLPESADSTPLTPAVIPVVTPPVAPAATHRRHFRALDGGVAQPIVPALALDVQFPVGAIVEMLYINDDESTQWYEGILTRSVLTVDAKGAPDLSYSVRFPGERTRSYKLSRNSLRLKEVPPPPSPPPSPPSSPSYSPSPPPPDLPLSAPPA